LIGEMAKMIFDDCEDCAVIVIDEENEIFYNNWEQQKRECQIPLHHCAMNLRYISYSASS
jgi:hypothetical protein